MCLSLSFSCDSLSPGLVNHLRVANPLLMAEKKIFYEKDDDAVVSSSKYHYRKWIQDTAGDGSKIFLDTRDQGDRYKNGYLWDMIIGKYQIFITVR